MILTILQFILYYITTTTTTTITTTTTTTDDMDPVEKKEALKELAKALKRQGSYLLGTSNVCMYV